MIRATVLVLVLVPVLVLELATPGAAAAQAAQNQRPDSAAATPPRPGLASWTTDRRDFTVGDVITILVDERTIASAEKSNVDTQDRGTDARIGYALPGVNGRRGDVTFRTRLDTESAARGQARRHDRLTTELSGRVVSVEPGGVLKVEATRTLRIDKQEQKVTLTGFARPHDISPRNVIESWRLADAELLYQSKGDLGNPKRGMMSRILGVLWP
jgi:flagellar L-ring protein precursor FlgH